MLDGSSINEIQNLWRFTFTFGGPQSEWGALILAIYFITSVKTAKFVAPWYMTDLNNTWSLS